MATHILVVDDETAIADLVEVYLKNEGFTIHKFYNASDALACVRTTRLNLAVLDVMLPDMDGFTLCQRIREDHLFPIIMLTAREEEMDKVFGIETGADDYMTKPFSMKELMARVKANIRRRSMEYAPATPAQAANTVEAGGLALNQETYQVTKNGVPVDLTQKEFAALLYLALLRRQGAEVNELSYGNTALDLSSGTLVCGEKQLRLSAREFDVMRYLLQMKGQNVSKEAILARVWGFDSNAVENHVEVYVGFLRKKLKAIGSNVHIEAARRLGYHLEVEEA